MIPHSSTLLSALRCAIRHAPLHVCPYTRYGACERRRKSLLSADVALQPSLLRQLEFTTTPAECRLPALFGSQRLSKPIARSCQIAAQPLPSYDSVRSAPATTFRRPSASVRRAASDRDLSSSRSYWRLEAGSDRPLIPNLVPNLSFDEPTSSVEPRDGARAACCKGAVHRCSSSDHWPQGPVDRIGLAEKCLEREHQFSSSCGGAAGHTRRSQMPAHTAPSGLVPAP